MSHLDAMAALVVVNRLREQCQEDFLPDDLPDFEVLVCIPMSPFEAQSLAALALAIENDYLNPNNTPEN